MKTALDKTIIGKWVITLAIPLMIFCIPTGEIFTKDLQLFLMITIGVILAVAFEFFNLMIPALLLPLLYILAGLSTFNVAFSGFASSTAILVVGALLFANVLEESGLLKRVAYWCILRTGGSFVGILYGIVLAGIALTLMTSGNGIYIIATLCYGVCRAFDLGVSKESALIMLCGAFASTTIRACVYTPGLMAIVLGGAQSVDPSITVSWGGFLFHNWPYLIFILALPVILTKLLKPTVTIENGKAYFQKAYHDLGPVTVHEKKAAVLTVILLAFLLTTSWHKIDMAIGFCLIPILFFMPGIHIGTEQNIKDINFSMVFFIVACLGIGAVSSSLGFGSLVSSTLSPLLASSGDKLALVVIWLFGVLANFLLTPLAILAGFSAPITQLALDLGIKPLGALYVLFNTLDQIVLPYEYVNYLMFFSFGVISMKDFIQIMGIKLVIGAAFLALVLYPWWHVVGVL